MMKRLLIVLCIVLAWATYSHSETKEVTVMFYLNGDSTLDELCLNTIKRIQEVKTTDNLHIVVLYDGRKETKPFDKTRFFYVSDGTAVPLEGFSEEEDMGSPKTLERFLKMGMSFPAERYILYFAGHGSGVLDVKAYPSITKATATMSPDETSGSDMTQGEFAKALENGLGGKKLDIGIFFTCLMQMVENGYSVRNHMKYIMASEYVMWFAKENVIGDKFRIEGVQIRELLEILESEPNISPEYLAEKVIASYIEDYKKPIPRSTLTDEREMDYFSATYSLIDCSKYEQLARMLDGFSELLLEKGIDGGIQKASENTQNFEGFEYMDLVDLMDNISRHSKDKEISLCAEEISSFVKTSLVVREGHIGKTVEASNGVSIYFPLADIRTELFESFQGSYKNSEFASETSWEEFVFQYRVRNK